MPIEYHRTMLADRVRNEAFHRALEKVIRPGQTIVADVGCGTGILGFMAGRLGAREVHLYESGDVMNLCRHLAKANRIERCRFRAGHSTTFDNPPPVDVVVSETLGNYAFEEQMIETVEDAKRFLKPGGMIIPGKVEQVVVPVVTDRFFRDLQVWDDVGFGLDFTLAKTMSLNNAYVRTFTASDLLDRGRSAQVWDSLDFRCRNAPDRKGKAQWTLAVDTVIYGAAVWWNAELVLGVDLSTSPFAPKTHWEQLYFPVLESLEGCRGDTLSVTLSSTSSYDAGTNLCWQFVLERAGGGKAVRQSLDLEKGFLA
ncbi:MAG: 50S ribosomal protein L11 methyltransferase [Pseudomonadota bacterium]|nr:50S ribosomal protein L11 methyltransferase [Pseudomonadota bacterium]